MEANPQVGANDAASQVKRTPNFAVRWWRASRQRVSARTVLINKHPLAIRWFHWINFPVLFTMIWSGLLIYWANDVFTITLFGHKLFSMFPDSWFSPMVSKRVPDFLATTTTDDPPMRVLWKFSYRLSEGMAWHFLFAWFFAINGLLYVTYLALSGEWRKIVPKPRAWIEAIHVVLYDLRLTKKPLAVRFYNAAQQIAYTGVIILGALMLLTGIAIYKPAQQAWLTQLFGGYSVAKFIHFWVTMSFIAFFLVHVGQVAKTGWNNFRGMVTGYELVTPEEAQELEAMQ